MAVARQWVYFFGNGKADGRGSDKALLGGKGAGLAEMTRIGLPVPAGFTITTEACAEYHRRGGKWPAGLEKQIRENLAKLQRTCKKKLGASNDPLLVSVRSGAAHSMPGMMETVLNLGLNDRSMEGLARASGSRRFALDAYRRLIEMYGAIARGIEREQFESAFDEIKDTRTRPRLGRGPGERVLDTEVNTDELETLVGRFKDIYQERCGEEFPQDSFVQLKGAINAVFQSWMGDKAVTYRRVEHITGLTGTAANICQMVFGNMGEESGTGVCFTRDPSTGESGLYGDWLVNAQGEDVVAGIRTPLKLTELRDRMPQVYDQLEAVRVMLEVHYKDMQDLEFTVENGKLYMLQCRTGKRSPAATFKIAVDQATQGLVSQATARRLASKRYLPKRYVSFAVKPLITKEQAIARLDPAAVERLFHPVLDPEIGREELDRRCLGEGTGAVPGAASGQIVFSADEAELRAKSGTEVILVRRETSPEDIGGMFAANGILTATGGKTSHAAVVARGWGKCCIVGCDTLSVNYSAKTMTLNGRTLHEGDAVTLDGASGKIFDGSVDLIRPQAPSEFHTLMAWCDKVRRLGVRANADTPTDAARAVDLGAEGIGLCRTEHMFFDPTEPKRMRAVREMILAEEAEARRRALDKVLPYQKEDFEGIFSAMDGKPVTIRLLDPPLHEFLPQDDNLEAQQAIVDELNAPVLEEIATVEGWDHDRRRALEAKCISVEDVRRRVNQLKEANPMLGHRGCRLAVTFPEILDVQVSAIIRAAVACAQQGVHVFPEIMIPLSIDRRELELLVSRVRAVADGVLKELGTKVRYRVGTMIETPRAALLAGRLAEVADFFSFGTNDLTQLTMALSRDDASRFLPYYLPEGQGTAGGGDQDPHRAAILPHDPFQSIDVEGVGMLVRGAVEQARATKPKLKVGICGEHGGDPASIRFFDELNLDYVSCSPLRVPIARLAAAQAALAGGKPRGRRGRTGKVSSRGGRKAPTRSRASTAARGR